MQDNQAAPQSTPPSPPTDSEPTPVINQPEPEKTLYTWQAPARLYKQRNREFFTTVLALVILISVILFFAKEFLLIAVILSFGFLTYALASVKPEHIKHQLTNKGLRTHNKFIRWDNCNRYWWEEKWGQDVIHVETPNRFPTKLILVRGEGDKEKLEDIFSRYVIKDKPEPSFIDNAATWLQEKVPLETEDPPSSPSNPLPK